MSQAQYIEINELGDKLYYKDRGMKILHRLDGPAAVFSNGNKFWYVNGEVHRLDGPAAEYANGCKSWYINGEKLSEEEFRRRTAPEVVVTLDEIADMFGVDVSKLKIVKEH
jgi:hypothetical protein